MLIGYDYIFKNESLILIILEYFVFNFKNFFVIFFIKNICIYFNQIKLKKDFFCYLYKMYIFVLKKKFYVGM